MKRFLKLTVLCAIAFSFTLLASQSFAKTPAKAKPARTHKHRINEIINGQVNPYGTNGANVGLGTDYPPNGTTSYGGPGGLGNGPIGTPPNGNPVKPHPRPIVGVPPIGVLTGAGKTL